MLLLLLALSTTATTTTTTAGTTAAAADAAGSFATMRVLLRLMLLRSDAYTVPVRGTFVHSAAATAGAVRLVKVGIKIVPGPVIILIIVDTSTCTSSSPSRGGGAC